MVELVELRAENAKTFDLGAGKRALEVHIGAIHYKDNYADPGEAWKDIDLNWVGNKITKAPYELTLEANKVTIRDKKSGEVSIIELLEIGGIPIPAQAWEKSKGLAKAFATRLEIVAENSVVRYARILTSDMAPVEAKYKVIGKPLIVRASDADGELPVETTLVDDILTEILKPDRPIKYPVRIDPTWQVGGATGSTDDCHVLKNADLFSLTNDRFRAGYYNVDNKNIGSAARFLNVTIPVGSTITLANLILTNIDTDSSAVVNSRLRAEANVNPATFSNMANFNARTWTTAYVNWDAIAAWTENVEYTSPDIKACIQEVIGLSNWASGNPMAVLWDDFEARTTQTDYTARPAYSYDRSTTKAPKLYVEYTVPSLKRGWWSK